MPVLPEPATSDDEEAPRRVKNASSRRMSRIRSLLLTTPFDDDVCTQTYPGSGTAADPYIVDYLPHDRHDAMALSRGRKWAIAVLHSLSTFAVTFASSAYASGIEGVARRFGASAEVATLGPSLYVLGFALGPLVWAPLSETCGRRAVYVVSFAAYTAFSVAAACAPNMRAGDGVVWPIAGAFLGEAQGWRWILGLVAILGGVVWIPTSLMTPETYAPFILGCRAKTLSRMTGSVYVSRLDAGKPPKTLRQELSISLTRPWIFLFGEPIVMLTSLYISIVYGTLYMCFARFPIVFQGSRGWSQGTAGLAFIGIAVGVCLAAVAAGLDNHLYARMCAAVEAGGGAVEPEARLSTAMAGSIVLPIGLFLFAWTTYPWVHWIAPIIGATLFSCGLVLVFISLMSYLVDSYTVYAASMLAANSVLRSLFGTAFPLFTTQMYEKLGDQWASSIPAFLALACLPVSFLFYKYGPQIRSRCKYSSEAAKVWEAMRRRQAGVVVGTEPNGPERKVE